MCISLLIVNAKSLAVYMFRFRYLAFVLTHDKVSSSPTAFLYFRSRVAASSSESQLCLRSYTGSNRNQGPSCFLIFFLLSVLQRNWRKARPLAVGLEQLCFNFQSHFWFRPNLPLRLDGRNAGWLIGMQRAVATVTPALVKLAIIE